MIPKIIHQTMGPHIPAGGQECFDSVKRHHPDWDIRMYSNRDMYSALGYKDDDVVGVEAADIFRLQLLHEFGGWYLDADIYCIGQMPTEADHYIGYEEPGWMPHKVICNWAMACEPGNKFIKACLDEAWKRLKQTGRTVIFKTGPGMMSELYERGDWDFEPVDWPLFGCRKFDRLERTRKLYPQTKAVHLFMGCWYRANWSGGFLPKVRMIQDYERAFR